MVQALDEVEEYLRKAELPELPVVTHLYDGQTGYPV